MTCMWLSRFLLFFFLLSVSVPLPTNCTPDNWNFVFDFRRRFESPQVDCTAHERGMFCLVVKPQELVMNNVLEAMDRNYSFTVFHFCLVFSFKEMKFP